MFSFPNNFKNYTEKQEIIIFRWQSISCKAQRQADSTTNNRRKCNRSLKRKMNDNRTNRIINSSINTNIMLFLCTIMWLDIPTHGLAFFTQDQWTKICHYCQALRFPIERLKCCHNGKVLLQKLEPDLHQSMTGTTTQAKSFKANIRQFNNALSFAFFGAKSATLPGHGPYCFCIHGQIYYRMGTLHPPSNTSPTYSQLYILDGNQAVEAHMQHNPSYRRDVMNILTIVLNRVNPYAAAYNRCIRWSWRILPRWW